MEFSLGRELPLPRSVSPPLPPKFGGPPGRGRSGGARLGGLPRASEAVPGRGRPTYPGRRASSGGGGSDRPRLGSGACSIRSQLCRPLRRSRQKRLRGSARSRPGLCARPGGGGGGGEGGRRGPAGSHTEREAAPGGRRPAQRAGERSCRAPSPLGPEPASGPRRRRIPEPRPRRPGSPPPPLLPHPTQLPALRARQLGNRWRSWRSLGSAPARPLGGRRGGEGGAEGGGRGPAPAPGEPRSPGPLCGPLFRAPHLGPPSPGTRWGPLESPTSSQRVWEELPAPGWGERRRGDLRGFTPLEPPFLSLPGDIPLAAPVLGPGLECWSRVTAPRASEAQSTPSLGGHRSPTGPTACSRLQFRAPLV